MLKINTMFEKEKFLKGSDETLLLVELEGLKSEKLKKSKSTPLNLSIAIDISGSMGQPIDTKDFFNFNSFNNFLNKVNAHNEFPTIKKSMTKIEQAKVAAARAIDNMQDGDFLSIVLFDNDINILVPAIKLDSEKRSFIKEEIKKIQARGGTDIHNGWLMASAEVAKNISSKSINRVLVLSDGQANCGIVDPKEIASNVKKMSEKSITTTCFGIGNGFNEDLLLEMSNVGGGNFYYIDDDKKLNEMFKEEFAGLKNLAASNVKVELLFTNGVKIKEQLNLLNKKDNAYILADIRHNKKSYLLFKLNLPKKLEDFNTEVIVSYKDENSLEHVEKVTVLASATTKKKWESLPFNQEVKVQETLLVVANNKFLATRAISMGDMEQANTLLMQSQACVNNAGFLDARLDKEANDIKYAMSNAGDSNDLRKIITSQSYITRYSR